MNENFIRFAQNGKHHPSKHPFLVLYTNDLRQSENPLADQGECRGACRCRLDDKSLGAANLLQTHFMPFLQQSQCDYTFMQLS